MAVNVLMPTLSPTMETGNLLRWIKTSGDAVAPGDLLAEIETDKATMEVEATDEGTLGEILVSAGTQDVPVGTVIAKLVSRSKSEALMMPAVPLPDVAMHTTMQLYDADTAVDRVFASPLARRLGRERNVDLAGLVGSGPHGRIVAKDIPAAPLTTAPEISNQEVEAADPPPSPALQRIVEPATGIMPVFLEVDCVLSQANKLVGELAAARPDRSLLVTDLLIKAHALALVSVPEANVSWVGSEVVAAKHADIAITLWHPVFQTPVIAAADIMSLGTIAALRRTYLSDVAAIRDATGTSTFSELGSSGPVRYQGRIYRLRPTTLTVSLSRDAENATIGLAVDENAVPPPAAVRMLEAIQTYLASPLLLAV